MMYMHGHGVQKETDRLLDELWRRLLIGYGVFSASLLVFGLHHRELGLPFWVAFIGGIALVPWVITAVKLEVHIARMNRETKARGRGWANS
jgi:hypothetical protein